MVPYINSTYVWPYLDPTLDDVSHFDKLEVQAGENIPMSSGVGEVKEGSAPLALDLTQSAIRLMFRQAFPPLVEANLGSVPVGISMSYACTSWVEMLQRMHIVAVRATATETSYNLDISSMFFYNGTQQSTNFMWFWAAFRYHSGSYKIAIQPIKGCSNVRIVTKMDFGEIAAIDAVGASGDGINITEPNKRSEVLVPMMTNYAFYTADYADLFARWHQGIRVQFLWDGTPAVTSSWILASLGPDWVCACPDSLPRHVDLSLQNTRMLKRNMIVEALRNAK